MKRNLINSCNISVKQGFLSGCLDWLSVCLKSAIFDLPSSVHCQRNLPCDLDRYFMTQIISVESRCIKSKSRLIKIESANNVLKWTRGILVVPQGSKMQRPCPHGTLLYYPKPESSLTILSYSLVMDRMHFLEWSFLHWLRLMREQLSNEGKDRLHDPNSYL